MIRRSSPWRHARRSLLAALVALPLAAGAQRPTSITFFGDSFTDMGMADVLSAIAGLPDQTPSPPYWGGPPPVNFPGTATDGPTWAAYFASQLGRPGDAATAIGVPGLPTGNNFAISGARTGLTGVGGLPIGLQTQLGLFAGVSPLPGVIPNPTPRMIDPTGLYVVWAGVNDIRDFAAMPPADPTLALQQSAANVAFAVQQLALGGARSFLVPRAPNSAIVPEVALDPAQAARRSQYTALFNGFLEDAIGQVAMLFPTARFSSFDLDPVYAAIAADAAMGAPRYGITNLTTPCFGVPGFVPPSDCDVALFSDALHPTTRAQQIVAGVAVQAVVPEPATIALVAGGLVVLAGVGGRRRATR